MNVLHVRAATSIWLVEARDLNPRGISIQVILAALKERYSFQSHQDPDPNGQRAEVFSLFNGTFAFEGRPYAVISAKAFNDGFLVTSGHSTTHADSVLTDAFGYLATQLGFTPPEEIPFQKSYLSELVVSMDKDFDGLFSPAAQSLCERVSKLSGFPLAPTAMTFLPDPIAVKVQPTFRFERETGKGFAEKRYWSAAPLTTLDHEKVLSAMEQDL